MQFCRLLFFALFLKVANSDVTSKTNDIISRLTYEINNWVTIDEKSEEFQQLIHNLSLPTNLLRKDWRSFDGENSENICIICKSVLNTFIEYRRQGMSEEDIKNKMIKICTLLKLQSPQVCDGVITINLPIILYIIDSKPNLTADTICGVLLESPFCPLDNNEFNWIVNIDDGPSKWIKPEESNETINILQITDIHYDPKYEPYGNAYCNEPTCCRKGQNDTNTSDKVAGYWGDYHYCDSPWHAIIDVLDHVIAEHQNISYVYFTGDIIDHGIWETSIKGNIESLNKSYLQIYETFKNIPIYPILGNHESHPVNQFAPRTITNDEISTQWLYKLMADLWIDFGWLPESTRSTILQGGFYTVSLKKGFRIIALNNNVCYSYNWWLLYQPQDPDGQLQWLADTLLQAEVDEEYVHILAHLPPGNTDCQTTWKSEYIKIVNRFAHIIRAQFNGHTHKDELQLIYGSDDNSKISNVAWNGGSITTYQNVNPNYKLYTIDSKNYEVKDFENWIYNLTLANINLDQRPLWYKSYSFKEEYGLSDLTYDSLQTWLFKLMNDEKLLNRYHGNYFKQAEPSLTEECDAKCMRAFICHVIVNLGDHEIKCE
ncbi:Sphingomyelin phosphodiesterase 1 [Atta colombica]|uniref:Sphingomyelin phosphodiesterase n=1 Tax=Atta colombica TaxID=520822 RepID=A0A151I4L2_9HYME|nr:PREDICTED: sphingomyelin phosphodiesterase 1-like [Atta colombica]KYM84646.1 Sphingomyelin phosphodiesterase 1 [Atta colombica]